jgi:hypothetical protein
MIFLMFLKNPKLLAKMKNKSKRLLAGEENKVRQGE